MAQTSNIEWTDRTWNPVRGCSRISEGCRNCYAEGIASRFSKPGQPYHGLAHRVGKEGRWTGKLVLVEKELHGHLNFREPQRVFVNSMSDLFHESLAFRDIERVVAATGEAPQNEYQVLTKRSNRMLEFAEWWCKQHAESELPPWIWFGVSIEDRQSTYRLEHIRKVPARIKFVSFEPLLQDVGDVDLTGISQVITGGESGPRRRAHDPDWQRNILRQARAQGVAFFGKQWDKKRPLPNDLMIREFPGDTHAFRR